MNFSTLKSLKIYDKEVVKLSMYSSIVWRKEASPEKTVVYYVDGTKTELDITGTIQQSDIANPLNVKKVVIGNTVTDVYYQTFANMANLEEVYANDRVDGSNLQFYHQVFVDSQNLKTVSLPKETSFFCWEYETDQYKKIFYNNPSFETLTIRGKTKEEIECMDFYPFGLDEEKIAGGEKQEAYTFDELIDLIKTSTGASEVFICANVHPDNATNTVVTLPGGTWYGYNIKALMCLDKTQNTVALFGNIRNASTDDRTQTFVGGLGYQIDGGTGEGKMFTQTSQNDFRRVFNLDDETSGWYHIRHQINRGKAYPTSTATKWETYLEMTGHNSRQTQTIYFDSTKWDNPNKTVNIWRCRDWTNYASAWLSYFKGGYKGNLIVNLVPCKIDGTFTLFDLVSKTRIDPLAGSLTGYTVTSASQLTEEHRKVWNLED